MTQTVVEMRVAVLVAPGADQEEVERTIDTLCAAGAKVVVVAHRHETVPEQTRAGWGDVMSVDEALDQAVPGQFDALFVPEQHIPDTLRRDPQAVRFVRTMTQQHKPIAAIGNGVGVFIAADLVDGRRLATSPELRAELEGAGGIAAEEDGLVLDGPFLTVGDRADTDLLSEALIHELERRLAAGVRADPPPPA